jgi:hypothetical protein
MTKRLSCTFRPYITIVPFMHLNLFWRSVEIDDLTITSFVMSCQDSLLRFLLVQL